MSLPSYVNLLAPSAGVLGLILAGCIYLLIKATPCTDIKITKLGAQIHQGAMVFLRREYKVLFIFAVVLLVGLYYFLGSSTAIAFVVGACCSALAGFIGMYTATDANMRTTFAASNTGQAEALKIAFSGGSIMGLTVASLGLLGLGSLYYFWGHDPATASAIHGFGMGASTVALFARVGGGIFTKSADIGADLVGKLEAGIPEDDPRNPGVIADNVGDNVGDVAGMGSDIFESYCGSIIATVAIASVHNYKELGSQNILMSLPLWLAALGLISSIIGVFAVRLNAAAAPEKALRTGTAVATILFMLAAGVLIHLAGIKMNIWYAVLGGAAGGMLIGFVTEYYTGGPPVKRIAKAGETGTATVMITGLAVGMQSVVIPLIVICAIIGISTHFADLYGVGIAAVGMLATVGMTMAIDAYGPVADNAGGIAEMSGLGAEVRAITDSLDELGNTTAAIGKGFAIGAAALAALAIITAFVETVEHKNAGFSLLLNDPKVLIGLFIGGVLPFLITAITMTAVGNAAFDMICEIRRQFSEIKGLLQGEAEPDTDRCIDIATQAALKRMIFPGLIAVFMPIIIGFGIGPQALGGMLGGALLSCVLLALMMANSGGAWDNAKKFVEHGNLGGKGSKVHAATVVGDTVGDPFKDTSGPSMNILINVMAIVSLVIAPLL